MGYYNRCCFLLWLLNFLVLLERLLRAYQLGVRWWAVLLVTNNFTIILILDHQEFIRWSCHRLEWLLLLLHHLHDWLFCRIEAPPNYCFLKFIRCRWGLLMDCQFLWRLWGRWLVIPHIDRHCDILQVICYTLPHIRQFIRASPANFSLEVRTRFIWLLRSWYILWKSFMGALSSFWFMLYGVVRRG